MKTHDSSERPQEFQSNHDSRRMCSKCVDLNHQRGQFSIDGWGLKFFNCRKCGWPLFGAESKSVLFWRNKFNYI